MTTIDLDKLMQRGVTAVQMGHAETARECFLAVIAADEQHEAAWFWLSQVVEEVEEQRICLENVLALNPHHPEAEQLLDQLEETAAAPQPTVRHRPALSPAGAVLYPERQVEIDDRPPPVKHEPPRIRYTSDSQFEDVWSREADLCAFCAQEVTPEQEKCPRCNQSLLVRQYRYETPQTSLHMYWVLVLGLGQIFLIQAFYDIVIQMELLRAILSVSLMLICFVLAAAIYYRQLWGHLLTMALMVGIIFFHLIAFFVPFSLAGIPLQGIDPAISSFVGSLFGGFGTFLRLMQLVTAILALAYAVLWASPDFERVTLRRLAWVSKQAKFASDYHLLAQQFAQAGMWATAVLHWQYAVSRAPTQATYMLHLGRAYQQLGFSARSRDMLQTALQHSRKPEQQATIRQMLQEID
jgi:tetratricopeptide (TPR) repeat protein